MNITPFKNHMRPGETINCLINDVDVLKFGLKLFTFFSSLSTRSCKALLSSAARVGNVETDTAITVPTAIINAERKNANIALSSVATDLD